MCAELYQVLWTLGGDSQLLSRVLGSVSPYPCPLTCWAPAGEGGGRPVDGPAWWNVDDAEPYLGGLHQGGGREVQGLKRFQAWLVSG